MVNNYPFVTTSGDVRNTTGVTPVARIPHRRDRWERRTAPMTVPAFFTRWGHPSPFSARLLTYKGFSSGPREVFQRNFQQTFPRELSKRRFQERLQREVCERSLREKFAREVCKKGLQEKFARGFAGKVCKGGFAGKVCKRGYRDKLARGVFERRSQEKLARSVFKKVSRERLASETCRRSSQ